MAVLAVVVGIAVFSLVWSTVLYLLLGFTVNRIRPWSVYEFIHAYGFGGDNAALLGTSFLIAAAVGLLAGFALFLSQPKQYFGDARWAYSGEIRKANLMDEGGVLLGRQGNHFLRNDEPGHVLVAAPTRSGKGVGIVIPNLLSWPDSVVVLDIKHENHEVTSGFRAKHGQAVFKWSPADEHAKSHRFNPLDTVRPEPSHRISDVQRLSMILLPPHERASDPMWQDEARDLFLGVVLYVLDTPDVPSTIGEVYRTLKTDADLADVFEHILDTRKAELDPACVMALSNFMHKAPKERSGVKSNVTASLNLWANPVIDAATSASDFDLTELRRKRMSIYVGVTLNQLKALARLLNLFFQQTVDVLSREQPAPDERFKVMLMIDEFASLGRMDIVAEAMAFLAGFNVRMVNIVQGIGQLDKHYGQGRENILQNSAIQVYFASNDETTTTYISKRLGTKTIRTQSRSDPGGFAWATKSSSYTKRELMLPEEVRQLDENTEIIFKENTRPVRAKKIRYYDNAAFKSRLLKPAFVPALKLEQTEARSFDLSHKQRQRRQGNDSITTKDEGGAQDVVEGETPELTAMADELQRLLAEEAEENPENSEVAQAAKRLKNVLKDVE